MFQSLSHKRPASSELDNERFDKLDKTLTIYPNDGVRQTTFNVVDADADVDATLKFRQIRVNLYRDGKEA